MKNLPVIASIISPEYLSVVVKERYNLSESTKCSLLRTGINHSYLVVENNKKYVLRIYSFNWRTKQEIAEELILLDEFRQNHMNVSFPFKDKNGEYIQEIYAPEGIRYAVLFSFAEGGKVRFLNAAVSASIGELIAKIHSHTINRRIRRINYNADTLSILPYKFASKYYAEDLPEMKFVKNAGAFLKTVFSDTKNDLVRKGIVHLDIWYDNMNITEEGNITLFDFDFCGNGWLVLDVAYFCMQLYHIESDKKQYEFLKCSFLDGYKKTAPISKEEIDLIPFAGLAVWIFYLGVQTRRFDWSNIFLTENYLKMYINKVKNWLAYHAIEITSH